MLPFVYAGFCLCALLAGTLCLRVFFGLCWWLVGNNRGDFFRFCVYVLCNCSVGVITWCFFGVDVLKNLGLGFYLGSLIFDLDFNYKIDV